MTYHHDQTPGVQKAFAKDVKTLVSAIEEIGNPFTEKTVDLYNLDTKDVMPAFVVESINCAQLVGKVQYEAYVEERLD